MIYGMLGDIVPGKYNHQFFIDAIGSEVWLKRNQASGFSKFLGMVNRRGAALGVNPAVVEASERVGDVLPTLSPPPVSWYPKLMKAAAKSILKRFHLLDPARRLLNPARRLRRRIKHPFKPSDRAIVAHYFAQSSAPKLNIGCGGRVLAGWLNTDYDSKLPVVMYLDTRQPFPFKEETFDYVFSEHIIEHMSYRDGEKMLTECFRVLKRFGKIRISTPDLAFLIDLTKPNKSDLQRAYIKWAANTYIPGAPDDNEIFVINNFVRDWGHIFIYDENTLRGAMTNAGFKTITKFDQHESKDAALRNLENEKHLPPNFLRLESFTLEGSK